MSANMATVLAENYQLKWHSHSTHLHSSVATLYRSDTFTDVTLVTTDGRYLAAHKFVLSACSSYLNRILQIGCVGSSLNTNVVIVLPPEISYRTLAILLQYMYSGEATVSNDQLSGVLKAGEVLRIKGLCHSKEKRPASETQNSQRKEVNGEQLKQVYVNVKSKNSLGKLPEMPPASTSGTSSSDSSKPQSLLKTATPTAKSIDNKNQSERVSGNENSCESLKDSAGNVGEIQIEENMKIELLVKEEPIDWDDQLEAPGNDQDLEPEITFKSEQESPDREECGEEVGSMYAPLTCDLCQETFTTPALWVRHIETHPPTDVPRKRRKKNTQGGDDGSEEDGTEFPPLRCELCQSVFPAPGEWVRHIQSAHTEEQLALSNSAIISGGSGGGRRRGGGNGGTGLGAGGGGRETCPSCTKTFPSHASMLIHSRTHTGEKPYVCCVCDKGFNVKSNLLRHLRTLHDHLINPDMYEKRAYTCSKFQAN